MRGLLIVALLMGAPAAAQDRMTQAQCAQSFDVATALIGVSVDNTDAVLGANGWCVVTGLEFDMDSSTSARIEMLRWRASDIGRFINDGLPPRMIEVEGRGFGVVPTTGDAVFDYLLQLQMRQARMAFGASVRWDGVQNAVTIDTAYLEFNPTNRIEVTARIEGANLRDLASIQTSIGSVALRNLTLKSTFDGWFESYAAMLIGQVLLEDGEATPQAQVTTLKRQAIEFIPELPVGFVPPPSRTALGAFINALPMPRGTLQMQLSAEPAIGGARTALILREAPLAQTIETLLDGVSVLVTWTPSGSPK